ncbi:twin-arginine translocase TatA/TatE family subunit [Isoptericola sp. AK164]|uniref:twin-arginine translocase TatA/TatE family subunit n=1 Tax=Isoptericola sp. AK164 TaxID=3024246 RepID=UPI0024187C9E|nr:twin-arginine translocase TatA/TatE family subunit [Isoptericola sp. AK164]
MGVFGINGGELVVIIVLALVLIGPERLPRYAAQLGGLVRQGKVLLRDAKSRVDDELGDELRDVDWQKLDPRQYDPRRIVKEALLDDDPAPTRGAANRSAAGRTARAAGGGAAGVAGVAGAGSAAVPAAPSGPSSSGPAPFDDEAT